MDEGQPRPPGHQLGEALFAYFRIVVLAEHRLQPGERADVRLRRIAIQAREGIDGVAQPLGADADFVKILGSGFAIETARALAQLARLLADQVTGDDGGDAALCAGAARGGRGQVLAPVANEGPQWRRVQGTQQP